MVSTRRLKGGIKRAVQILTSMMRGLVLFFLSQPLNSFWHVPFLRWWKRYGSALGRALHTEVATVERYSGISSSKESACSPISAEKPGSREGVSNELVLVSHPAPCIVLYEKMASASMMYSSNCPQIRHKLASMRVARHPARQVRSTGSTDSRRAARTASASTAEALGSTNSRRGVIAIDRARVIKIRAPSSAPRFSEAVRPRASRHRLRPPLRSRKHA